MKLTISKGLQDLINMYCESTPKKLFWGTEHRGALVAVSYSDGYVSNLTIPNSLFERSMTESTKEQLYLIQNKDLVVVPYFYGTSAEFAELKDTYISEMHSACPYMPMLMLINDKDYKVYNTETDEEISLVIADKMPYHLQDKVSKFLGFLKQEKLRAKSIN